MVFSSYLWLENHHSQDFPTCSSAVFCKQLGKYVLCLPRFSNIFIYRQLGNGFQSMTSRSLQPFKVGQRLTRSPIATAVGAPQRPSEENPRQIEKHNETHIPWWMKHGNYSIWTCPKNMELYSKMIELNDDFPTTHVWWHRRVVKSDQISCGSTESQKNPVCQWVQVLTHDLVFSCIFRRQEMPRTPLRISSSRFSCVSVRISFQIPNMNTMDDMFGIYPPKFWLYRNVPILFGSYVCCPYYLPIFDMNIHRMSMSHNSANGMSTTKNANICDFCYWTLNINILIGSTMLNLHLFFCIGQIVSMPPELLYISHILPEYFLHGLVWNA